MLRCVSLVVGLVLVIGGCQGGGTSPTGTSGSSPGDAASAGAVGTPAPTAEATKPIAVPRPSDLPLDGSCEDENTSCLGLLAGGTAYSTKVFTPTLSFTLPGPGWENRVDQGGIFQLLSTDSPGDLIAFFREPRAVDPSVGATVSDLADWLARYPKITVTKATNVKLGGLSGVTLDIRVAAGATGTDPGCPVQVCIPIFTGHDPNLKDPYQWNWDWGSAGLETQRLYLLTWPNGVIAIFVDSLDGTTFEAMTQAFDRIAPTLKFG